MKTAVESLRELATELEKELIEAETEDTAGRRDAYAYCLIATRRHLAAAEAAQREEQIDHA